jgi:hypothetical protein
MAEVYIVVLTVSGGKRCLYVVFIRDQDFLSILSDTRQHLTTLVLQSQ